MQLAGNMGSSLFLSHTHTDSYYDVILSSFPHSNMAWRCTGKTSFVSLFYSSILKSVKGKSNMELVENLKQAGIITKQRVVDAMNKIDRYIDLKDLVADRWLMLW